MDASTPSEISAYDEIVLYTVPSAAPPRGQEQRARARPDDERRPSHYHTWVYTKIPLPIRLGTPGAPEAGHEPPREIGGMPLVGHEEFTARWEDYPRYPEYLNAFREEGGEALSRLRPFVFGTLTPGLLRLLQFLFEGERPRRRWWSSEAPELEDLAWESIELGPSRTPQLSLVRGRPRDPTPPLVLLREQPLCVAVFDPAHLAPEELRAVLENLGPGMKTLWLQGQDPRAALCQAARAGVEVLHVVADGSVPLGVEGLLDFPGGATLSPEEIAVLLRGSRVTVLSLSAPAEPRCDGQGQPTVFRGFARVARVIDDGPTIVAPLAPLPPPALAQFWSTFYRRLAEALDVEDALMTATPCPMKVPIVLFLRHRAGRQFTRCDDALGVESERGSSAKQLGPEQAGTGSSVRGKLLDSMLDLQPRSAPTTSTVADVI
jgi:hypothetical protein